MRVKSLKWDWIAKRAIQQWRTDRPAVMAVDTETEGTGFYDSPFAVTLAWRNADGVQSHYIERGYGDDLPQLLDRTPTLVFHNAKFDLQKLLLVGVLDRDRLSSERIEDTETLAYLTNEHWDKHLKVLARDLLGLNTDETKQVKKAREKLKKELGLRSIDEVRYHMIPRPILYPYAKKDAVFTLLLHEYLRPGIARFEELEALYAQEMELALAVLDVEAAGMKVRLDYVQEQIKDCNREMLEAEFVISDTTQKKVWYPERQGQKTPEGCFNPNSWQQILAELAEAGIEAVGTDEVTLGKIDYPLAAAIVKLRKAKKLRDTYFRAMLNEQQGGIQHPWFNISRVVSGRFSSSAAKED